MNKSTFKLLFLLIFVGFCTIINAQTINLTSAIGSENQSVCGNENITAITYAIGGGATGASVTGLPFDITGNYSNGTFTISGAVSDISYTYNFTITTTGGSGTAATSSGTIITTAIQVPIFTPYGPICSGDVVPLLPASSNNNPPITGIWSPPIIDNTISGTYTFTPTTGQCASPATIIFTVDPLPLLVITDPGPVCKPMTIDVTDPTITQGSHGGTLSYFQNPAATIPITNPSSIYSSGTYYILSTSSQGCRTANSVDVTIFPPPTFEVLTDINPIYYPQTFDLTDTTFIKTDGVDIVYYFVQNGDLILVADPNSISTSGTYSVVSINELGCTDSLYVEISIIDFFGISISHPSFGDELTVNIDNDEPSEITISDISGFTLLRSTYAENPIIIDISSFSRGQYFVKVENNSATLIKSIIK